MGRATIISGGTDGRYVIEMDYGVAQRDALIAKIDLDLYQLGLRKTWQEDQLEEVELGLVSLQTEQAAFINAYVVASKLIPPNKALTDSIKVQLDAKTAEVTRQQLIVQNARNALHMTTAQIKSAELDKAKLNLAEVTEQRQAWCADLTENATGAVATLEVPGESALILVKPSAPEATITDGRLIAREVQTPAQVFWNAAVLPGWQKFLPTYRWGTITALDQDADKCTVELADALSSAQRLNVNQAATLANVPIRYMECHSAVFNVGDRVIVEFTGQDWTQPVVIGFVDNPRACGGAGLYCIPASNTAPYGWSPPTTDGTGAPINGGKGIVAYLGDAGAPAGVARDGTNRTAGVVASIISTGIGPRTIRGKRADASGIPTSGPTEVGNDDHPLSFSSLGRRDFEWLSKTGAYLATAFDNVRVNGRDLGKPAAGIPYRAFVPAATLTGGTATVFCLTADAGTFHLYRRPLTGGPSVAWTLVASHDVTTYGTNFEYLRRIVTNDDASILTIWFCDTYTGVGCLDLAIPGGAATWIDAVTTFSKNYDVLNPSATPDEIIDTFTTQFSVDYVDNAKVFATLTGTKRDYISSDGNANEVEETIIADFWGEEVTVAQYVWEHSQTFEDWTDGDGVDRTRFQRETHATLESKQIYWFGGAGDPILFTRKNYGRTMIKSEDYEDILIAGLCAPGDSACFAAEGRDIYYRIPAINYGSGVIHGGETTLFSELSRPMYEARDQLEHVYTLPPEAGGEMSTFYLTWLVGEWGRTSRATPGSGYWPEGYGKFPDVARRFQCFFMPATSQAFGSSGYHWTASNYRDTNLCSFFGFAVISQPSHVEVIDGFTSSPTIIPTLNWPPNTWPFPPDALLGIDTSAWQTYCSDPSALARYALDLSMTPGPNRLKYLQLGSPS